jgi:protein ImuA
VPATFYPPAAAAWGIDLSRLIILRPANEADALWALDQALRCPGVGAVLGSCDRLDVRDFRRLQLAAETGGTLGLLLRPDHLRGQPTWADVQWRVSPRCRERTPWRSDRSKVQDPKSKVTSRPWTLDPGLWTSSPWRLRVELLRCRGGAGGASVIVELDETTSTWREAEHAPHPVLAVAELADPTPAWRA